jgi:hypothetical protein
MTFTVRHQHIHFDEKREGQSHVITAWKRQNLAQNPGLWEPALKSCAYLLTSRSSDASLASASIYPFVQEGS